MDGIGHRLDPRAVPHNSERDLWAKDRLAELLLGSPVPGAELPKNLLLYMRREALADVLAMDALYRRVLHVPGVVMELGVRWGRRMALLLLLREIHEPYNATRRVIGFDTFAGFPSVGPEDGHHQDVRVGSFAVPEHYDGYLQELLEIHESESALGHMRRFELCRGDVGQTLPGYLDRHPETIVAMAYFDLDIYQPTRASLEAIRPRLVRGSVLVFDQLNHPAFPGETRAVMDVLGLTSSRLEMLYLHPSPAFVVL
jgi:hypothetical protein